MTEAPVSRIGERPWTPGPWGERHSGMSVYPVSDENIDIARVYMPKGMSHATNLANARLIAAAPDLYEAADEAHAFMSIVMPTTETAEAHRIVAKLRAALSRARGESNGN